MSTEYVIFSCGEYINTNGKYGHYDYALTIDDPRIAKWLAEYFDGTAIDINDALEHERAYHLSKKQEMQSRLDYE